MWTFHHWSLLRVRALLLLRPAEEYTTHAPSIFLFAKLAHTERRVTIFAAQMQSVGLVDSASISDQSTLDMSMIAYLAIKPAQPDRQATSFSVFYTVLRKKMT